MELSLALERILKLAVSWFVDFCWFLNVFSIYCSYQII
jgi:hypothetical protein